MVYSSYNNSPDCSIYDSDFNLVSRANQTNAGNAWATSGEIWSDYTGWNYTNGQVSSSSAGTYWIKATPCYSVDGHQLLRLSANGGMAMRQPDQMGSFMANFGVIVGPEGYRQPMSLWFSGTTLRQYTRGGFAQLDQLTTGLATASAAPICGFQLERQRLDRLHREPGTGCGSSRPRKRQDRPMAFRSRATARTWRCSRPAPATPARWTPTSRPCPTTSYGIEQGSYYGMRHQITWDNQWVAAFAPYYYYGSGLSGHVVNTDDPTRYYRLSTAAVPVASRSSR
ncbi:hypothetical protein, partial [Denitratisoma oestradiolicum]|uniref:hypothetical protein n=1 Tax=Denitratisoma oestradiolicum TaxID=311182 RepID=UPI0018D74E0A